MHPYMVSLFGGALIGLSASLLLLFNGRTAGISGIAGGLLLPSPRGEVGWRLSFVLGLVAGGGLLAWAWPTAFGAGSSASPLTLILGGLLVGFGTRLGGGCTSGHGVCGIARGSTRSLAATVTFMVFGALTVFVSRHLLAASS